MDIFNKTQQINNLIIVDDEIFSESALDYLHSFGLNTHQVTHSRLCTEYVVALKPDAVIINWRSQQMDCETLCRELFEKTYVPILVFCYNPSEEDCIKAFDSGADEFLRAPFHPRELHARLKSVSRRFTDKKPQHKLEKLRFENWLMDLGARKLMSPSNQEVPLSVSEFDLLARFVKNPHTTLSRGELLSSHRHHELTAYNRSIDIQISRIRHKIEHDPKKPTLIKTVRCGGYVFTAQVEQIEPEPA